MAILSGALTTSGPSGGFSGTNNNNKNGNRGKGNANTNTSNKQQHVSYVSVPLCSSMVMSNADGRLLRFSVAWQSTTDYPWILKTVSCGYVLLTLLPSCTSLRLASCRPRWSSFAMKRLQLCYLKVLFSVLHKSIRETALLVICLRFLRIRWVPSSILNLKRFNAFLAYNHFKMEGLDCVKCLIERGDWMVKLDLQDAYYLVAVSSKHCKFLRFYWKGSLYEYICFPFGLFSAPRTFTKLTKSVVAQLRGLGIRLIIYLDDLLILNMFHDS